MTVPGNVRSLNSKIVFTESIKRCFGSTLQPRRTYHTVKREMAPFIFKMENLLTSSDFQANLPVGQEGNL